MADMPPEPDGLPSGLTLPYESNPVPSWTTEPMVLSGGVVVAACVLPLDDGKLVPAVQFRFALADGSGFLAPIVYAGDQLDHLGVLVLETTRDAHRAAEEANR